MYQRNLTVLTKLLNQFVSKLKQKVMLSVPVPLHRKFEFIQIIIILQIIIIIDY